MDVTPISQQVTSPVLLENQRGQLDAYFPFELSAINFENRRILGVYEASYLSIFTSVDYLRTMCGPNHGQTFEYRIREQQGHGDFFNTIPARKEIDPGAIYPYLPKSFRQEIHLLIALGLCRVPSTC